MAELEGATDLPVRAIGIHDLGESFNPTMYTGRASTWLREDPNNRPWRDWRVPIASRPAQQVEWRDVIILDSNNEFFAVQNLSNESLDNGANRTKLKNAILAAATITDTDIDGLPDRWEFDTFGDISKGANTRTDAGGLPALLAYAFSQSPGDFLASRNPAVRVFRDVADDPYLQLEFRRRLAGEDERLEYRVEVSDDGETWREAIVEFTEVDTLNPWDGTGTEIVTLRSADPIPSALFRFARVAVEVPL